jgi:hypothetical protein
MGKATILSMGYFAVTHSPLPIFVVPYQWRFNPMADFKKIIDARIRKLQVLRELADDPETMELLRSLAESNGNGHKKNAVPPTEAPSSAVPRLPRGHQKKTVLEVLRSATEPVTTDWIADQMIKRGFEFKAAKPPIAVNEALQNLSEKKLAKIAKTEGVRNYWKATAPKDVPFQMEAPLQV